MSLVLPEHAVHGNDARAEPAYSLKFYQLCVKVDRLYTHQLQVLIHDRRPQLVRRKFEAEEERRARFWRHAGETMLGRDEEPKASEELREREERSSELSLSSSMFVVGIEGGILFAVFRSSQGRPGHHHLTNQE